MVSSVIEQGACGLLNSKFGTFHLPHFLKRAPPQTSTHQHPQNRQRLVCDLEHFLRDRSAHFISALLPSPPLPPIYPPVHNKSTRVATPSPDEHNTSKRSRLRCLTLATKHQTHTTPRSIPATWTRAPTVVASIHQPAAQTCHPSWQPKSSTFRSCAST